MQSPLHRTFYISQLNFLDLSLTMQHPLRSAIPLRRKSPPRRKTFARRYDHRHLASETNTSWRLLSGLHCADLFVAVPLRIVRLAVRRPPSAVQHRRVSQSLRSRRRLHTNCVCPDTVPLKTTSPEQPLSAGASSSDGGMLHGLSHPITVLICDRESFEMSDRNRS